MSDNARILNALLRLGIARQAPPDEATQQVYLEELLTMHPAVVEQACHDISRQPRGEYESAFPSAGRIIEACRAYMRQQSMANTTKQLVSGKPADDAPLTKDEARAWITRLKADVEKRRQFGIRRRA